MAWLIDTNILSDARKPRPDPKIAEFFRIHRTSEFYVSVVTFAEIRFGIELLDDHARRAVLTDWLTLELRPMFEGRVLQLTEDILLKWRMLMEQGRKTGHTYSQIDLIIAATALHHGLTVVTRDRSDYDRAGVPVLNPWEGS
jgi:predicted nucleic acid-binding protein